MPVYSGTNSVEKKTMSNISVCQKCIDQSIGDKGSWKVICVVDTGDGKRTLTVSLVNAGGSAIYTCLQCKYKMEHIVMSDKNEKKLKVL